MENNKTILTGTSYELPTHTLEKPPEDYDQFLAMATDVFVQKDTDYDSRYMRGLMELDATTIWAWEVDKKLDRIRTWITRGELQVQGEGLTNAVVDLFNYTVQYVFYLTHFTPGNGNKQVNQQSIAIWQQQREKLFFTEAVSMGPTAWVLQLERKGRIQPEEELLKHIIQLYMGRKASGKDWQLLIRDLLEYKD